MKSLSIDLGKQLDSSASQPEDNLCYLANDIGTFWLQGKKSSQEGASRATFVWYHGLDDVDTHSERLEFKGVATSGAFSFWHYDMDARNENGTTTLVHLLLSRKGTDGNFKVYYKREGIDSEFILWTWDARLFEGHEDAP